MLLTVDEARLLVTTTLGDDALRMLLDAAEEAIDDAAGPLGSDDGVATVVERYAPRGSLIVLTARAQSVTSIVEGTTTLEAAQYALAATGSSIRRLDEGIPVSWVGDVVVTYVPRTNIASRQSAQAQLAQLFVSARPGVSSQTIGPWSEVYGQLKTLLGQRQDILSSITAAGFEGIR